jgi:D-alanyl-D-alanine carboxypeptidase
VGRDPAPPAALASRMRSRRHVPLLAVPLVAALCVLVGAAPAVAGGPVHADPGGLQRAVDDLVHRPGGPPAVIVTLGNGPRSTVLTAGTGDLATGRSPQPGDAMRVASVAKAFSGATALGLVARGVLSLDDRVGTLLPDLPAAWHEVTLRQLLGHTSGLPDFSRFPRFQEALLASLQDPPPPRDLLGFVDDPALLFAPGTRYQYSNSDNVAVALMVEAATGRTYADVLQAVVLGPARLFATSLPEGSDLPEPYLHGYDVSELPPEDVSTVVAAGWSWASGGVVSTPQDLARFIGAYVRGDFVDRPTRAGQFDVRPGSSEPPGPGENSAGLALFRYDTRCGTVYGHTGNTLGYTQFAAATEDGARTVTVSVNAQITPESAPERFADLREVYELATCAALASGR